MYKKPKKSCITDKTKIYLLTAKYRKNFIEFSIVFSVDSKTEHYQMFRDLSEMLVEEKGYIFNKEDVEQYLVDYESETIDILDDKYLEPIPDSPSKSRRWNPPETAYSRLLKKNVKGLVKLQDPTFRYEERLQLFYYSEFVINCAATRGIIEDLKKLKKGETMGMFTEESNLLSLLKAMRLLWH